MTHWGKSVPGLAKGGGGSGQARKQIAAAVAKQGVAPAAHRIPQQVEVLRRQSQPCAPIADAQSLSHVHLFLSSRTCATTSMAVFGKGREKSTDGKGYVFGRKSASTVNEMLSAPNKLDIQNKIYYVHSMCRLQFHTHNSTLFAIIFQ
jgi:hypothetical protein